MVTDAKFELVVGVPSAPTVDALAEGVRLTLFTGFKSILKVGVKFTLVMGCVNSALGLGALVEGVILTPFIVVNGAMFALVGGVKFSLVRVGLTRLVVGVT